MRRIIAPLEIGAKALNVLLWARHGLPPVQWAVARDLLHRLVIVLPFRRFIELGIAQGQVQRIMAQEFFDYLQGRTGIEQVGRKCVPPMPSSA